MCAECQQTANRLSVSGFESNFFFARDLFYSNQHKKCYTKTEMIKVEKTHEFKFGVKND